MLELGIMNFMMFFVVIGIGLIFVIAWIVKSEMRLNMAKSEIAKLTAEIESSGREKFALEEKLSELQSGQGSPDMPLGGAADELRGKNEALEEENKRLKDELGEAKVSLEEVYKALSSKE